MAQQIMGYQYLLANQYDTYDHWREFCLTHGINVDFSHGNQCWDVPALLYFQYGLRFYTGNGYAYGTWTIMRDANAKLPFIKVGDDNLSAMERKTLIKRGDIIVFSAGGLNYTGHVGFADSDYTGDIMPILGQNQGQGSAHGTPSNIVNWNLSRFLGAFRNTNWQQTPTPQPVVSSKRSENKFPFVLYADKLRNQRK